MIDFANEKEKCTKMKTNGVYTDGKAGTILSFENRSGVAENFVKVSICRKTVSVDASGDYVIPEYLPEIRKLIRIDVKTSPPTRFASATGAKIGGSLEYDALYVGADGKMYSSDFSAEYDTSVPFDESVEYDTSESITVLADVIPESVSGRVIGARKINIRCCLAARVGAIGGRYLRSEGVPTDSHVQRLVKKQEHFTDLTGTNDEIELRFEPNLSDGTNECICSDCKVLVEETASGDGYVDCKGYAFVKLLARGEDGGMYTVNQKLPFSEIVEVDGNKAGSLSYAYGLCTYIKPEWKRAGDEGSSEGEKLVRVGICLSATAFKREELEYIKDIYSTERACITDSEECTLVSRAFCKNGNMTFSVLDGDEVAAPLNEDLIDVVAHASPGEVEYEDGKCILKGKCRFGVVYKNEEFDDAEIMSIEKEFPFRYEFSDINDCKRADRLECSAFAIDPKARMDNGKMKFDCEIAVVCKMLYENKISYVTSARFGEEHSKKNGGFTVCYPDRTDDLWSIAKKYKTVAAEMVSGNGIDADLELDTVCMPEGKKYIIV